jgi:hypothetical protein
MQFELLRSEGHVNKSDFDAFEVDALECMRSVKVDRSSVYNKCMKRVNSSEIRRTGYHYWVTKNSVV